MSRNKNLISVILSVVLSVACVAAAASAATTISTNISTEGTLTVTGLTTLGNASTSVLSVSGNSYVGTVSSGAWNGTAIGVTKGGTGLTSAPSYGQLMVGNASSGYTLSATSTLGIALSDTTGTLAVARGGTNLTSYTANQLLYASGATTIGQIATSSLGLLTTDVAEGTNQYWTNTRFDNRLSATTTLPSLSTLAGLTTVGTIGTGVWQGTAIGVTYGGTGLSSIASGVIMYTSAANTIATSTITAAGRAILDDADAAAQLVTLGLTATAAELNYTDGVTSAIQTQLDAKQASDADLTTYAGITPSANIQSFLGSADYATARTNLGLAIGTNVQAYDADLTNWANYATTTFQVADADLLTYAGITPSANVQTLLGAADYAAFKTSLSLNSVENTALSTWAGSSNITTLGTLTGNLNVNGKATTTAATGAIATEGSLTIGAGTAITKHLSASASLDFPSIAANACQELTITVTGAADGNTVSLGIPNALASASSTLAWSGWVSAANTASVRVCQVAATATSDPAAATIRADVWQH